MAVPALGAVPADYFSGAAHVPTGELAELLNKASEVAATRTHHESVVTAATSKSTTGKEPTEVNVGPLLLLSFTLNNDEAYRQFKIPNNYVSGASLHVHWTKTSDAVETGKAARWRVEYVVFPSSSSEAGDASAPVYSFEVEDTYDDAGTTTRLVYKTPSVALSGVVAGYYAAIRVTAVTPAGTPLASEPGLFSVDLTYVKTINA